MAGITQASGPDEFLPEANFTNPLDAPSMGGVMIQNLLAELDVAEEWYYSRATRVLYFFPNRTTAANGTAPTPPTAKDSGPVQPRSPFRVLVCASSHS